MTSLVIALVAFVAWSYLAIGRGGFWRARSGDDAVVAESTSSGVAESTTSVVAASTTSVVAASTTSAAHAWPDVVAVIPARDEAALVGAAVASLLGQRYAGRLSLVVVDDHSGDGTADAARRAAADAGAAGRVTVLSAPPLAAGWTGKLAAVAHGVAYATASPQAPPWLLLTDADIRYEPDAVAALVSSAIENRLVLSSLMVRLRCESLAERTLIPAFVFFFQMLYPFAWVADPSRRTAAAAGGCVLLNRTALEAAGGIASIRGALIDDCALARRLKPQGPIRLALATRVESLRPYPTFDDIRRMVVRSAYAQLGFSSWRLLFVIAAMGLVFIAPVVLAAAADGPARWIALATWALMALLYAPILARYRVALGYAPALPAIAATYLAFTVQSAWLHRRGQGGQWKGRTNGPHGRVHDGPHPGRGRGAR